MVSGRGRAAWQHQEEEVASASSPRACPDLEDAAWAPIPADGEAIVLSQVSDSFTAKAVLGG